MVSLYEVRVIRLHDAMCVIFVLLLEVWGALEVVILIEKLSKNEMLQSNNMI